jgi:hypothetical protein
MSVYRSLLSSSSTKLKVETAMALRSFGEGRDYIRNNDPHVVKVCSPLLSTRSE